MFDEETEELAAELGLDVAFPPAELRHRMDSKIETTRLGNEAGVPSVPNTMGAGTDYRELLALATGAGPRRRPRRADALRRLRPDDVLHRERGRLDGSTRRRSWASRLKVMKRIEPRELAIEGVITRHGTLGRAR